MQDTVQISEFGKILVFLVLGVLFILAGYIVNLLLAKRKPNTIKNATYECGEEPSGNSWIQFNMRFYVIAIIFLLFDVEIVFLYPWATIYANKEIIEAIPTWGYFSLIEMFIFISILLLGLVYVWRKGDLNWIKNQIKIPSINTAIPQKLYEAINQKIVEVKAFEMVEEKVIQPETVAAAVSPRRPPFRSAVKKSNDENQIDNN